VKPLLWRHRRAAAAIAAAAVLLGTVPAAAAEAVAPYEPDLLRLAEILGALSHLRALCGASDGPLWRDRMAALLAAESASPDRRDRLAGTFNASFRAYRRSYHTCTPEAETVIRQYLAEGARLTRDVVGRYGE
jgi:uncharacterized protein (TIGR02301 family)